jgi:alkylation response protein AidB-like acyl-CoA dehydrogenase
MAFDTLFILGRASVPLAVAFTMHQYITLSLATVPLPHEPYASRREALLFALRRGKLLLAVSSFGNAHTRKGDQKSDISVATTDGRRFASGHRRFQCMASKADLLIFTGALESGVEGVFCAPLAPMEIHAQMFEGPMALTDTRGVTLHDAFVPDELVLSDNADLTDYLTSYSEAWFESLIGAAYLGGAHRALDELSRFLRRAETPAGASLSTVDGLIVEVGRLQILLRSSLALAGSFATAISNADAIARSEDQSIEAKMDSTNEMAHRASLIKYACTRNAEEIVASCRRLMGTQAMSPQSPLSAISGQIVFGPLHPKVAGEIERSAGRAALASEEVPGLFEYS